MEKSIQFKGLSYNRSEQLAVIGECSLCEGAEIIDGALRPAVLNGSSVGSFQGELLAVHEANGYTHFIVRIGSRLTYYNSGETSPRGLATGDIDVSRLSSESIGAMGNTLVVTAPAQGIFYIRFDPDSDTYVYLGKKPPMISIQFRPGARPDEPDYDQSGLEIKNQGNSSEPAPKKKIAWTFQPTVKGSVPEVFTVNKNRVDDEFDYDREHESGEVYINGAVSDKPIFLLSKKNFYIRSEYKAAITESVYALMNRTHESIAKQGRFYAPFFIRYVYRMFDGSIYCGSAPVLVSAEIHDLQKMFLCNTNTFTETSQDTAAWDLGGDEFNSFALDYGDNTIVLAYKPVDFNLEYKIDTSSLSELKNWSEVITSVDFFISPPLVWNDDSKLIEKMSLDENFPESGVSQTVDPWPYYINQHGRSSLWREDHRVDHVGGNICVDIPQTYPTTKEERFSQTSTFYRLKSIKLEDLKAMADFADIDVKPNVVKNITSQERMKTDEFGSYSSYIPAGQYIYNNRLNIYGIYESLFSGFPVENMLQQYVSGFVSGLIPMYQESGNVDITSVAVKIATNDGAIWVRRSCNVRVSRNMLGIFPMYYPDSRAVMMQLSVGPSSLPEGWEGVVTPEEWAEYNQPYITFKMREHPELNGSITDVTTMANAFVDQSASTANISALDDDILTSQAANPFVFPADNASHVSNGKVVALASATRPLSSGQFGSFPLVSFCTDGIWALETAANGSYSAVNPISREVCAYDTMSYPNGIVNQLAKSVVQLDQSLMFTTSRGLCQLIGSEVVQVSQTLVGRLPDISSLFGSLGSLPSVRNSIPGLHHLDHPLSDIPVVNGNMAIRLLYDYIGRRLLVFQKDIMLSSGISNGMVSADGKSSPCLIYTSTDKQFTSMHTPPLRSLVNGYPYPYVQLDTGLVLRLDKDFDESDNDHNILIVSRHMSLGGFRDVIKAIRHEKDFAAVPAVFLFGSQDAVNDYLIGIVGREHADYLPGHPFRYYRIALALTMKQYERYTSLIVDVTQKHSKL